MIEYKGGLSGEGRRIGIVVSRFNELITKQLLEGAHDGLLRHGVGDEDIFVAWVPGAWEIPAALARLLETGDYDAVIGLGCVIRGATPHFDFVSEGVARGIADLGMHSSKPVIFGVLTTDTIEQAVERAGTKAGNKGYDAAVAAIEMAHLFDQLDG